MNKNLKKERYGDLTTEVQVEHTNANSPESETLKKLIPIVGEELLDKIHINFKS